MNDAPGSRHKSCYLQCRPVAVSRWRGNPSAHGSPPPHRKASCRRRNSVGPSAARCTKDNSVLWPGACRACHAHCLLAGCPDPGPPPDPQCARQSLPHPSRHTPHSAPLFSLAGSQPTHPACSPPPSQGAALDPSQLPLRLNTEHPARPQLPFLDRPCFFQALRQLATKLLFHCSGPHFARQG